MLRSYRRAALTDFNYAAGFMVGLIFKLKSEQRVRAMKWGTVTKINHLFVLQCEDKLI